MWLRVLKDNLKACVPGKPLVRRLVRAVSPYRSLPANDDLAFAQGLRLVAFTREYGVPLDTVVEVGTGWIPTIPHILKACGAGWIILTDVERLCDEATFAQARRFVESELGQVAQASLMTEAQLQGNLSRSGVEDYRCPPRTDDLADGSVDLVYSRTVLEHIRPPLLETLLQEWRRLLRPGGCGIHFIDNSDHFEHADKHLSRLNFLTVPDWAWAIATFNGQNYQSRLRHSDYVTMFRAAGFDLVHVEAEVNAQALADLDSLDLTDAFRHRDRNDLATLTSIIVARNPAVAPAA